jgi:hypothetical protein
LAYVANNLRFKLLELRSVAAMANLHMFFLCITFMVCLESSTEPSTLEASFGDLEEPQFQEAILKLICHKEKFPEILETPRLRQNTPDEQDAVQNKNDSFDSVLISKKYSTDFCEFQENEFSFCTRKGKEDFFLDLASISKQRTGDRKYFFSYGNKIQTRDEIRKLDSFEKYEKDISISLSEKQNTSSYFDEKDFSLSQEKKTRPSLKKSKSLKNIFEKDAIISDSFSSSKETVGEDLTDEKIRKHIQNKSFVSNDSKVSTAPSSRETKMMLKIIKDLNENPKTISQILNKVYGFYPESIPSPQTQRLLKLESPKKNSPQHNVKKSSRTKENISSFHSGENLLSNYYKVLKTPSSKDTKRISKDLNVQSPKKISEILNEAYGFYPESISSPQTPISSNLESPKKNSPQHYVIKSPPIKEEISKLYSNENFLSKKPRLIQSYTYNAEKYTTLDGSSYNFFVKAFLTLNEKNKIDMVQNVVEYRSLQLELPSTQEIEKFVKALRNQKDPNKVSEKLKKIYGSYRESILPRVKDLSSDNGRGIFQPCIGTCTISKKKITSHSEENL